MKLRTFYSLSKWGLVLDLVFILSAGSAFYLWQCCNTVWGLLFLLPGLLSLFKSIEIHITLPKRYKAWQDLVNANTNAITHESFKQYIIAPCGRALTLDVLAEINKMDAYKELKERYYKGFWGKDEEPQVVIVQYIEKDSLNEFN